MHGKRLDIQGLRAIAVLLVFANHLLGWPTGGFVGVDVFFVISGFLITGHLVKEHDAHGKWSFKSFYVKRARRILPAALTVTIVTIVAGFMVFSWARASSVLTDGIWATPFAANWRFIAIGTDYMHAGDALSPLQHYWSLSIEEQFYFIWPLILAVALLRSARRTRRGATIAITIIGIVSFAFGVWETSVNPTTAYFSTFARVWELAAGALLAIVAPRVGKLPSASRPYIAWAGLGLIAVSAIVLTPDSAFPGPWAILPVLGSAAVIAAGINGKQRFLWPIRNRVAVYIGDMSYSLYLWHFPVIVFVGVFLAGAPRRIALVSLVVAFALSAVSYTFIENPARSGVGWKPILSPLGSLAGITAVSLLVVGFAPRPDVVTITAGPPIVRKGAAPATTKLWADIDHALTATKWPALYPDISTIGADQKAPAWVKDGCLGMETKSLADPIENAKRCWYGPSDAKKTAVVLGDSVAISWLPGIRTALEPAGYKIQVATAQQCPVAAAETVKGDGAAMGWCGNFRNWAVGMIAETKPDLVIVSNFSRTLDRLVSKSTGSAAEAEWQSAAESTYRALAATGSPIVALQGPPTGPGFYTCSGAGSKPSDCLLTREPSYIAMAKAEKAAAAATGVEYVDTSSWFCNEHGACPSFTGTTPVLVDQGHLSAAYSKRLGPVLAEALIRD